MAQPGIFMTTPKEPNFFSDEEQFARGMDWYTALYCDALPGDLLGEASTHYTKLPTYPKTVERIMESAPCVRLIYVMRHPVDRLISHYIHEWSMGVYDCDLDEALDRYPELIDYGLFSKQLQPYVDSFGRENVLPVFFDRLFDNPQSELERITRFIGYKHKPVWLTELKPSNISHERIRRFPYYDLLIESSVAAWLRRNLVPEAWRNWVKSQLSMTHRPEFNEEQLSQLEAHFDADLAKLGGWLGVELNCRNFKEVSKNRSLEWCEGC